MKYRKLLTILLAVVFVVCVGRVGYQLIQYRQGDKIYSQAEEVAGLPHTAPEPYEPGVVQPPDQSTEGPQLPDVPPQVQTLLDVDLAALQAVNSDVLGWITVPDTDLNYPIVQAGDNQYYLNHTWNKTWNSAGAIFLDWHVKRDFSDYNTIIYGHRMGNSSMFGTLKYYKDLDYWQQHPELYIATPDGVSRYEIFAAYEVSVLGATYRMSFPDEASRQEFLDFCLGESVIDTGIVPAVDDQVVTLSTCTGRGHATRWVVQAVLAEQYPAQ